MDWQAEALFEELTRHRRLRIRTSMSPSGTVADSFDLDKDTEEAVRQMRCVNPGDGRQGRQSGQRLS